MELEFQDLLMNNFLSQILSTINGGAQNVSDYFKAPGNPYDVKSPIPNEQLVTRNLPSGVKSPVPQNQIAQHVQGGSGFQNTMNQVGQFGQRAQENVNQWANVFTPKSVPSPTVKPTVTPSMVKTTMPTTTVTPTPKIPTNAFRDFKTVSVEKIPIDYQDLITASAGAYNLPPALLASLLFTEHGFSRDPGYNYNSNGSYDRGPAQINSTAHPEVSDAQALDPNFAIPWAAKVLAGHIKNLGIARGIVAYNTGASGSQFVQDLRNHPYYKKITTGLSDNLRRSLGL